MEDVCDQGECDDGYVCGGDVYDLGEEEGGGGGGGCL